MQTSIRQSRRDFAATTALAALNATLTNRVLGAESPVDDGVDEFDYIVIGAGSSGCVVASRLSEQPDRSVLLLEAGGPAEDASLHEFPAPISQLLGSRFDWKYETLPEAGLGGRRIPWPRGKVMGGTSAINAMVYIRGNRLDFDKWGRQNDGWRFEDLLPLFKLSEANADKDLVSGNLHGSDGPLSVESATKPSLFKRAALEAFRAQGFDADANWDFNGERQENAAGYYQFTVKGGRRHSTASAFVLPHLDSKSVVFRPNLVAKPWSLATRLEWESDRVVGVEYVTNDWEVHSARARREVIVCAGSVDSAQLLNLSGIGDSKELTKLGIPVRRHLPGVGRNLQDHLLMSLTFEPVKKFADPNWAGFGGMFYRSSNVGPQQSPDLQFYFADVSDSEGQPELWLGVSLGTPYSRGQITLSDPSPLSKPIIRANYLGDERDWTAMIEGFEFMRNLAQAKGLRDLIVRERSPGSQIADARQAISSTATTIWHPAGTCKMGSDDMAVVDSHLQVHGVPGLRVADASIMPTIINGNTSAPCIMIGEKAAKLIQES